MGRELLVKKGVLLGLIDKTYQIEALYKKGELQQGAFILESFWPPRLWSKTAQQ